MTGTIDSAVLNIAARPALLDRLGIGHVAAAASLGAGAIHAAAIGVHNEHPQAVRTFVVVAAFQLIWGAISLAGGGRTLAAIGALGNAGLIGGWILSKSSGISFIAGLDAAEPAQFADVAAAVLAGIAVVGALASVMAPQLHLSQGLAGLAIVALAAVAVPGMVRAGSPSHAGHGDGTAATAADGSGTATDDHGDDHGSAGAATPVAAGQDAGSVATDAAHSHGDDAAAAAAPDAADHAAEGADAAAHTDHAAAVVPPQKYDPNLPIDLSGVEGVTPEQQARAENLIAITLDRLPKFANYADAEALGWRSIGDGLTGHEHFVNWDVINDDVWLNPDEPESLVYEVDRGTGERTLVSAMFMLPTSYTLDTVPDVGGALMQWHIHNNLCYTVDPAVSDEAPLVRGLTNADGGCNPPLVKLAESPMIHVWITPHPCGPFAALEGIGAGQVKAGEEHACDAAHGG
jgi:hypothetical protein